MSTSRRLSAKKSKRQSILAKTKSLDSMGSMHKSQHVVRKIELERNSVGQSSLDKTSSTDTSDSVLEMEFEAIENNWSRFVGFPMQVLLLVSFICLPRYLTYL